MYGGYHASALTFFQAPQKAFWLIRTELVGTRDSPDLFDKDFGFPFAALITIPYQSAGVENCLPEAPLHHFLARWTVTRSLFSVLQAEELGGFL